MIAAGTPWLRSSASGLLSRGEVIFSFLKLMPEDVPGGKIGVAGLQRGQPLSCAIHTTGLGEHSHDSDAPDNRDDVG